MRACKVGTVGVTSVKVGNKTGKHRCNIGISDFSPSFHRVFPDFIRDVTDFPVFLVKEKKNNINLEVGLHD